MANLTVVPGQPGSGAQNDERDAFKRQVQMCRDQLLEIRADLVSLVPKLETGVLGEAFERSEVALLLKITFITTVAQRRLQAVGYAEADHIANITADARMILDGTVINPKEFSGYLVLRIDGALTYLDGLQ